jgi:hypothetical protein
LANHSGGTPLQLEPLGLDIGGAGPKNDALSEEPLSSNRSLGSLPDIAICGDRIHFDHSGTRGRDELGGSPFHPEGPGNDSDETKPRDGSTAALPLTPRRWWKISTTG